LRRENNPPTRKRKKSEGMSEKKRTHHLRGQLSLGGENPGEKGSAADDNVPKEPTRGKGKGFTLS